MAENNLLKGDAATELSQKLAGPMLEDSVNSSSLREATCSGVNELDSSDNISIGKQSTDVDLQLTCFTEESHDVTLHFQIIRLINQIYIWIGCNSGKFGHLYASAPTRPNNTQSVTTLLGGGADSTGSSIARRLVLRTGLNIILACNIPKNSPMLEAHAERILIQKLKSLGYIMGGQKRLSGASVA